MGARDISLALRFAVLKRDHFTCMYCGSRPPHAVLHVDHVQAVARGGSKDERNLITACSDCNHGKSDQAFAFGKPDGARYEPRSQCECARPTCRGATDPRDLLESTCWCAGCHACDACGEFRCKRASSDDPIVQFGGAENIFRGCETAQDYWDVSWRAFITGDTGQKFHADLCMAQFRDDLKQVMLDKLANRVRAHEEQARKQEPPSDANGTGEVH